MNPDPAATPGLGSGVAIVGAGPAGLMAAEVLARAGIRVDLYDAMPSVGRKFLLAGRGGLNLTDSEPPDRFIERYPQGRPGSIDGWPPSIPQRFAPGRRASALRPSSAAAAGSFRPG